MKNFNVNLSISANDQNEVEEKLQAFQDLQDNLEHEDLLQAVEVVVDNPEIIEFIKEVAPEEGEELGLSDYLSIARKAYQKFG
jgi:hypothetical protein